MSWLDTPVRVPNFAFTALMLEAPDVQEKPQIRVSSICAMEAGRYTHDDLIAYADHVRPGATRRLITDWIGLGLLDRPAKPGLGRGRGSEPATWSSSQRELFLNLWRQRPSASIVQLSNIPVYLWMFWGDEYVPLRQVRRAMLTWLHRIEYVSVPAAEATAQQISHLFGKEKRTRATRELLAEALRGRAPDLDQVREQVSRMEDSLPTEVVGADHDVRVDSHTVMGLIAARLKAERRLPQLPDSLYQWARFFAISAESAYARDQPSLAANRDHGSLFSSRRPDNQAREACAVLLTLLGVALGSNLDQRHVGSVYDPAVWEARSLRGHIRDTRLVGDGLAVEFEIVGR